MSGFIATGIFPFLRQRFGLVITGGLGVAYQFTWLIIGAGPGAACAVAGRHCGSVRHLLVGLVLSRTGVWVFDLSLSQLMQEEITIEELGTVSGVHNSICAALGTSMFVAGIVLDKPEQFGILMALSLVSVRNWTWLPFVCFCRGGGGGVLLSPQPRWQAWS